MNTTDAYELWTGGTFDAYGAPTPQGIQIVELHRAVAGEYQYLHGPQIIEHNGILYTSWANSLVDENSSTETMQGRRSGDGGKTWSEVEVIGPNPGDGVHRRSHGAFGVHKGILWSFNCNMGNVSYQDLGVPSLYEASVERDMDVFSELKTEARSLDPVNGTWIDHGTVVENFWPCHEPRALPDGCWLMAGMNRRFRGTVAISEGDTMMRWHTQAVPLPSGILGGEATTWVDGGNVTVFLRNDTPARAGGRYYLLVAHSTDAGRTWSEACYTNYPFAAKPFAGVLSTRQRYIIGNTSAEGKRDIFTIGVSAPGEQTLCKLYRIQSGAKTPRLAGAHKDPGAAQYPGAWEAGGKLYVVYSIAKEDAGLAIIPLESLEV